MTIESLENLARGIRNKSVSRNLVTLADLWQETEVEFLDSLSAGPEFSDLALIKRGHKIGSTLGSFGGYQAIRWDPANKVFFGASESRKDGQAAGF